MMKKKTEASFEEFLQAPSRLAEGSRKSAGGMKPRGITTSSKRTLSSAPRAATRKEKVGLTIDPEIVDAVDDYIYHERKQGRRLRKNDVYEAALRQFLGLEEGDAR